MAFSILQVEASIERTAQVEMSVSNSDAIPEVTIAALTQQMKVDIATGRTPNSQPHVKPFPIMTVTNKSAGQMSDLAEDLREVRADLEVQLSLVS